MRKLPRLAFNSLTVLSLALLLATIALAVRAEFAVDKWSVRCGREIRFESFRRHVFVIVPAMQSAEGIGFEHSSGDPIPVTPKYWQVRFGTIGSGTSSYFLAIPHWLMLLISAPIPAWRFLQARRDRKRLRSGLCVRCGYDLRASPDRCPECGTPATSIAVSRPPAVPG